MLQVHVKAEPSSPNSLPHAELSRAGRDGSQQLRLCSTIRAWPGTTAGKPPFFIDEEPAVWVLLCTWKSQDVLQRPADLCCSM